MRNAVRCWRRVGVQLSLISNLILLLLLAFTVVATGGVDWWPAY